MTVRHVMTDTDCRGWLRQKDPYDFWEAAIVIYDVNGKQSRWPYLLKYGELTPDLHFNLGRLVAVVRANHSSNT